MRFIDDQGVIAAQQAVALELLEQNTVGHEFDLTVGAATIVEADLVPHGTADGSSQLFRQPGRQRSRRDPARLGVPY